MPSVIRIYSTISIAVFSCSVYYAAEFVKDASLRANSTSTALDAVNLTGNGSAREDVIPVHLKDLFSYMIREPLCFWPMMNMTYCALILLGKLIQKVVFGELQPSERQHLQDTFLSFIFYKFMFVFGVLNVQNMDEIVLWGAWYTALGFLDLLFLLCWDRFLYTSLSPTTTTWAHVRLLALLAIILAMSLFMLLLSTAAAIFFLSFNTYAFMATECISLAVRTIRVLLLYGIHLYDTRSSTSSVDRRGLVAYYIKLVFDLTDLGLDLFHHVHMLLWSNILLSMASLTISMQLKYLLERLQSRISKHQTYLAVLTNMEQYCPMASRDELVENADICAICWETMESARKLPCGHLYHNSCLQSWFEQDTSCPTCRLALNIRNIRRENLTNRRVSDSPESQTSAGRNDNHFFHFDGSRYVSWLPSVSVEVTHNRLRGDVPTHAHSNSQLENMVNQVQQLFPHYPRNIILDDLRSTRTVDQTVENILDGRLILPLDAAEEPEVDDLQQNTSIGQSLGHYPRNIVVDDEATRSAHHSVGNSHVGRSTLPGLAVQEPEVENPQNVAMVKQVQQLFPHYPRNIILHDLRTTRSAELTIENILEGRLTIPRRVFEEPIVRISSQDAMVKQVQRLFPHYPRNIVLDDLRTTRSAERTVDNILDGRLAFPLPVSNEPEIESSNPVTSVAD